jgi:PPOX class probable F420-dependent enzyme
MIDDTVKELATGKNFAALTTLFGDGHPQTQIMWVGADDEHVLINTEVHRQKYKNVQRDPRVTVTVFDAANPYHYAEVRGRVVEEVRGDVARAHIDELSQKYMGAPYGAPIQSERVLLKIAPDSQRSQ